MRILVICKKFLSRTETFIYNEIDQLSRDHEVKVLTLDRDNADLFPFRDIEELGAFTIPGWVRLRRRVEKFGISMTYKNPGLRKAFAQKIREFKPDIIHCHYGPVGLLFTQNVDVQNIPVFVSFHGFDASQRLRSAIYCRDLKKMFERPDIHPIFVSNFMYNSVVSATKWDGKRKNILYYGVNSGLFNRAPHQGDADTVVFAQVSSFAEKKGHIYTVRAFKKYLESESRPKSLLVLAGSGQYFDAIKSEVGKLGIAEFVRFPGHVDHKTAKDIMNSANVFIHHSITAANGDTEGIPNALIEAMAMELPVLSTIHAGIPELVENGVNGYLVKEKDVDDLADKMLAISSWNYRPANRAKVMEIFDNEVHMRSLYSFYHQALQTMAG